MGVIFQGHHKVKFQKVMNVHETWYTYLRGFFQGHLKVIQGQIPKKQQMFMKLSKYT